MNDHLKTSFRSESAAKDHIRLRKGQDRFRAYRCTCCGLWHLTTHVYIPLPDHKAQIQDLKTKYQSEIDALRKELNTLRTAEGKEALREVKASEYTKNLLETNKALNNRLNKLQRERGDMVAIIASNNLVAPNTKVTFSSLPGE
jgi:hypothetical protein